MHARWNTILYSECAGGHGLNLGVLPVAKSKSRNRTNQGARGRVTPPARRPERFNLEVGDRQVGVQFTETKTTLHQGPLPTPDDRAAYNAVLPGCAERILRCVEIPFELATSQHDHRIALEKKVIQSDIRRGWAGIVLGGVIALTAVGGGVYLVANDKSAEGVTAIVAPVTGIAGVFVYSDRARRKERTQQRG